MGVVWTSDSPWKVPHYSLAVRQKRSVSSMAVVMWTLSVKRFPSSACLGLGKVLGGYQGPLCCDISEDTVGPLVLKPSLLLTSQPPSGMAYRRVGSLCGTQRWGMGREGDEGHGFSFMLPWLVTLTTVFPLWLLCF